MGNITQQLEMKKRLNCKSFDWFMKEIAFDVLDKYPELPPNVHWGEVSWFSIKWQIRIVDLILTWFIWLICFKIDTSIKSER